MSVLPSLRAREIIAALFKIGFRIIRSRGSHFRFENPITKRKVSVSFHPGDISKKNLHSILKQASLTVEEFLKALKK
jgi:predicted RNA binding protein YcfA (HicA-like mRNA interferase family)